MSTSTYSVLCNNGDLRLVSGTEGLLEICNNEEWGTVCDDFWDDTDASVACYQLGYGRQGTSPCRSLTEYVRRWW